jgi:2-pyrone-4,6-dicarboxylate lactonase
MQTQSDDRGAPPTFRPPFGACDAHCHIVGPLARFPAAAERRGREDQDATLEMLLAKQSRLGLDRAVVVQSGAHGTDPSTLLDALAREPRRLRGVAVVEQDVSRRTLETLHRAGVRGVRETLVHVPDGQPDPEAFLRLAERIAEFGWSLHLHMRADQIFALRPLLRKTSAPIVIDHLMRLDATKGVRQPEFDALLELVTEGAWIKIAAVDKLSRRPYPHLDSAEIAARLVAAAPDRAIWGTDWPHPDSRGLRGGAMPDDGALLALAPLYAPDPTNLHKLLVDNPAQLYGFAPS